MTPEELQWQINLVRDRYQYLNLTNEQAGEVYKYEEDKSTYSDKHYFSVWEEWDYELTTFREILNNEQLNNYESSLNENIRQYEQSLIAQDKEKVTQIGYHEELVSFYETKFLPGIFRNPYLNFGWLLKDKAKVEYLRAEYKRFLNDVKKEILTSHFRQYRTFMPNELKTSLLRHKLQCVFPDYSWFKHTCDEPTKVVTEYLEKKFQYLPDETKHFLTRKFQDLNQFVDELYKRYHSDNGGGYVVYGQSTGEEETLHRAMALLLHDKDRYGY